MSNKIFKYHLALGESVIDLPETAKILSVQVQADAICLWAIVSPEKETEARRFIVVGTGHELPEGRLQYLATVQQGPFVWHAFEVMEH